MRIGVTGHQERSGADWPWVAEQVRRLLSEHYPVLRGFSCLAVGADQVFATEVLASGVPVTAVVPLAGYERYFDGEALDRYRSMLERCDVVQMPGAASDEEAFLVAGRTVCDEADVLVAVWDGRPAEGLGGTADIVRYALESGKRVIRVDPIDRTVTRLGEWRQR